MMLFGVVVLAESELTRESGLRHQGISAAQKPSRAATAVQWQQHVEIQGTTLVRDTPTTLDLTSQPHTLHQHINVFHSSPKPLGRLGEPALHSHHLQGPAVHRWLHPSVRSSRPHWSLWHEYVARIVVISRYIIILTRPQTTASRTCPSSLFLHL